MAKSLMTVEEVAEYLRVKSSTVYEWAKKGKIPAAKVGRLWRFDREEIEEWVRNNMNQKIGDEIAFGMHNLKKSSEPMSSKGGHRSGQGIHRED